MATPWREAIKNRNPKFLTVFADPNVTGGIWARAFKEALKEFNRLSLPVVLRSSPDPPSTSGPDGADVQFKAGSGAVSFTAFNESVTKDSQGKPLTIDGNTTAGVTFPFIRQFGLIQRIDKVFIFVPATPKSQSGRIVGDPVKLIIAVHELIHACGLENSDHSAFKHSEADIFNSPQVVSEGKDADHDTCSPFGFPDIVFPPLQVNSVTTGKIRANWS